MEYDLKELNVEYGHEVGDEPFDVDGMIDSETVITREELWAIRDSFVEMRGEAGYSNADLEKILKWAICIRTEATFIDMIINGDVDVDITTEDGICLV